MYMKVYKTSVTQIIFNSLETRRGQWKKNEEDRIANTPDPDLPPGHRVLPESERKTTLTLLKQSMSI